MESSPRRSHTESLPIRSNRISWKRIQHDAIKRTIRLTLYPYLLGQIGLVGN